MKGSFLSFLSSDALLSDASSHAQWRNAQKELLWQEVQRHVHDIWDEMKLQENRILNSTEKLLGEKYPESKDSLRNIKHIIETFKLDENTELPNSHKEALESNTLAIPHNLPQLNTSPFRPLSTILSTRTPPEPIKLSEDLSSKIDKDLSEMNASTRNQSTDESSSHIAQKQKSIVCLDSCEYPSLPPRELKIDEVAHLGKPEDSSRAFKFSPFKNIRFSEEEWIPHPPPSTKGKAIYQPESKDSPLSVSQRTPLHLKLRPSEVSRRFDEITFSAKMDLKFFSQKESSKNNLGSPLKSRADGKTAEQEIIMSSHQNTRRILHLQDNEVAKSIDGEDTRIDSDLQDHSRDKKLVIEDKLSVSGLEDQLEVKMLDEENTRDGLDLQDQMHVKELDTEDIRSNPGLEDQFDEEAMDVVDNVATDAQKEARNSDLDDTVNVLAVQDFRRSENHEPITTGKQLPCEDLVEPPSKRRNIGNADRSSSLQRQNNENEDPNHYQLVNSSKNAAEIKADQDKATQSEVSNKKMTIDEIIAEINRVTEIEDKAYNDWLKQFSTPFRNEITQIVDSMQDEIKHYMLQPIGTLPKPIDESTVEDVRSLLRELSQDRLEQKEITANPISDQPVSINRKNWDLSQESLSQLEMERGTSVSNPLDDEKNGKQWPESETGDEPIKEDTIMKVDKKSPQLDVKTESKSVQSSQNETQAVTKKIEKSSQPSVLMPQQNASTFDEDDTFQFRIKKNLPKKLLAAASHGKIVSNGSQKVSLQKQTQNTLNDNSVQIEINKTRPKYTESDNQQRHRSVSRTTQDLQTWQPKNRQLKPVSSMMRQEVVNSGSLEPTSQSHERKIQQAILTSRKLTNKIRDPLEELIGKVKDTPKEVISSSSGPRPPSQPQSQKKPILQKPSLQKPSLQKPSSSHSTKPRIIGSGFSASASISKSKSTVNLQKEALLASTAKNAKKMMVTTTQANSEKLFDVPSDYSDEEHAMPNREASRPNLPQWAESPILKGILERQATRDPDTVFPPIKPPKIEEIFGKFFDKSRLSQFRSRSSSSVWSPSDMLNDEEKENYREAMGYQQQ